MRKLRICAIIELDCKTIEKYGFEKWSYRNQINLVKNTSPSGKNTVKEEPLDPLRIVICTPKNS